MSQSIEIKVNDKVLSLSSKETAKLLAVFLTVENPLAGTLDFALSQKSIPANSQDATPVAMREFFPTQFIEGKNPDDVFQVTITSESEILTGTATRQVLHNKMLLASNRDAYQTKIERVSLKSEKSEKPAKVTVSADNV